MTYVGLYFCDDCTAESPGQTQPTQAVWKCDDGAFRCREHVERKTGVPPPRARTSSEIAAVEPPPPAQPAWQRIVHGLRARHVDGGLQLQCVRQVEGFAEGIGDCDWVLPDEAVVELVLLASRYRDASGADRAQARVWLIRLLAGGAQP